MKKSLVIISFAFIFLLSVSMVSASWFSELFSGKSKTSGSIITQDFQKAPDVKKCFLCNIFPTCNDGVKNQDETDVDCGGNKCSKCEVELIPFDDQTIPDEGGESLGGESCETLDIEKLFILPGNVGIEALNNRFIDFSDDEILTIDETFSTQLEKGNSYLIPIPSQECYWEASYDGRKLEMITVCSVPEKIV